MPRAATLITLIIIGLTGCAAPAPVESDNTVAIDPSEYPRMVDAAVDALRSRGFVIDRRDYRFGRITAKPAASPTILEPWKSGNSTAYQTVQSTLNDERRLVTVFLDPSLTAVRDAGAKPPDNPPNNPPNDPPNNAPNNAPPPYAEYELRVEVVIERWQDPTLRLTGSTDGRRLLAHLRATPNELVQRGINGPSWRPVGRDPYMERQLLAEIVRRSVTIDAVTDQPATTQPLTR